MILCEECSEPLGVAGLSHPTAIEFKGVRVNISSFQDELGDAFESRDLCSPCWHQLVFRAVNLALDNEPDTPEEG